MIYSILPIIITLFLIIIWIYFDNKKKKHFIFKLTEFDSYSIINKQKEIEQNSKDFTLELIQAGLTTKQYKEGIAAFFVLGLVFILFSIFFFSSFFLILGIIFGLVCILGGGKLYILISKNERSTKIDEDLATFLNLINIILEAGGGLKNALFQVTKKANGLINQELLKEIAILEYEMTNYSTITAYKNLKKRVDSNNVNKMIDFLILSEETGVGVKNIFSLQGEEMRKSKLYKIKGKVNTLNLYLMLTIFIFILPAIGAFIILPMMSGKIEMF
ncbi:hypothetical protein CRU99_07035 [Malaciobacter mytili]|uniref:type II secretion system F family protein n=1 Tax=Malaciobacter mytili TaxID=603050 RepID=UPI00100B384F|nr:type II secretion system F family protein [Malaciobacter mytili]RXI43578.1 hypothetical protein CRU99_07035 [Malaciobacter mytili]